MEQKLLSMKRILERENTQSNPTITNTKIETKSEESPNFLLKLYRILETPEYSNIIHWNDTGEYFIVKNLHDFTESILPKFYKHNNFSSFVRQLNMYDFHKKKSVQNEHIFQHKSFIRGQKELIQNIKRKNKKELHSLHNAVGFPDTQNNNLTNNNHDLSMIEYFNNNNHKKATKNSLNSALKYLIKNVTIANEKAKSLEEKVEKLGKQNEDFLLQNQQMLQEIIAKSEYNKKLEAVVYFILDIIMKSSNAGNIKNCGDIKKILITKDDCRDDFSKPQIESQQIGTGGYTSIIPFNDLKCKEHQGQCDSFQKFLETFAQRVTNKSDSNSLKKSLTLPMLVSGEDKYTNNNNNYFCSNDFVPKSPNSVNSINLNPPNPLDLTNQLSPIRLRSRKQSFDTILSNNNGLENLIKRKNSEYGRKNSGLSIENFNMGNRDNNNNNNNNVKETNSNENSFSMTSRNNIFDLEFNCGLSNNNEGKEMNMSLNNSNMEEQGIEGIGGGERKTIDKCFFEDNGCI